MKDNGILIGEGLTMLDYELIKEKLQQMTFEYYIFDFTILKGVDPNMFTPGDKNYRRKRNWLQTRKSKSEGY